MTEKRYFKKEWEEEYYIFDSETVTERDFEEKLDYEGYRAFEDSMMGDDVVDRLNEQHETIQSLEGQIETYDTGCKEIYNDKCRLEKEKEEDKLLIDELYLFRLIYNAHLFNQWHKHNEIEVYKSLKHHDGSIPFEDDEHDWFIVVAILPTGQITNHYPLRYWEYFKIPIYERVKDEFDGHTSKEVWHRLARLIYDD